jgi:predicted DCC family thiol-disulfide oxidoreductase YuxK
MPQYQVFYDHACPMCRFEILRLQRLAPHGQFELIDISATDFNAANFGVSQAALEAQIHIRAQTPNAPWLIGIDAIAALYAAIGSTWWQGPLHLRATRGFVAALYRWVAAHRYGVSRVLGFKSHADCASGACSIKKLA